MTLLEQQLRAMPLDQLLEVVARVDEVHQAVHAELDSRPSADQRRPTQHGTGCSCCGAGVKQWR